MMFRPFHSSDHELKNFFPKQAEVQFRNASIIIKGYPFEPSVLFNNEELTLSAICSVSINARPAINLVNEVIFLGRNHTDELSFFATRNKIPVQNSSWVWSWILEPFLDTELTPEKIENLHRLLGNYGLSKAEVSAIRDEVKEQMMKYNFDTMLWEWVDLDLFDVLCAMRTKYDAQAFGKFYRNAMELAMRPEIS